MIPIAVNIWSIGKKLRVLTEFGTSLVMEAGIGAIKSHNIVNIFASLLNTHQKKWQLN